MHFTLANTELVTPWMDKNKFIFCIFFTEWPPAAIFDAQKSLLIVYLAISDQEVALIFFLTKWPPAVILAARNHF